MREYRCTVGTEFIFLVFCIFVEYDYTLWMTYSCKRTLSFSSSLIFKGKAPMNKERGADQQDIVAICTGTGHF